MQRTTYLAGGCFWGLEAYFKRIPGIITTSVGYSNGHHAKPSYEEVCRGSGHVETVKVTYDDGTISLSQIIQYFLRVVDPFSINKQDGDEGIQYRSGIYYESLDDKATIEEVLALANCPSIPFTLPKTIIKII